MELLLLVGLWLGLAFLARWIALEKGRNAEGFFLLAALCPVIGLIAVACARPDREALAAAQAAREKAARPTAKVYTVDDYRRAAALRVGSR